MQLCPARSWLWTTAILSMALAVAFASAARATTWFVSPSGSPTNAGTYSSPWDLGTALLGHSDSVRPGDKVYLLDGNYPETFTTETYDGNPRVKLLGTSAARITVCPEPNATHVRICGLAIGDVENYGGGNVYTPTNFTDFINLEFCSSQWIGDVASAQSGPWPGDIPLPHGGANLFCGSGNRLINCVLRAGSQGIASWQEDQGFLACGNIVYGNGWNAPDGGHGHAICSQNGDPNGKYFTGNILTNRYVDQMTAQCYGSSDANVNHFWLQNNIAYSGGGNAEFMIGGEGPCDDEHMLNNVLYQADLWAGYYWGSRNNLHYEVKNNYLVDATLNYFSIQYLDANNNTVIGNGVTRMYAFPQSASPTYSDTPASPTPSQPAAFLFPNTFAGGRGHLAVFNWNYATSPTAQVNLAGVVAAGSGFKLMDPKNLYGAPLYQANTDLSGNAVVPAPANSTCMSCWPWGCRPIRSPWMRARINRFACRSTPCS